ncbi:leucine-rich repeat-containing protein [Tanacetum coccineum]
MRENIYFYFMHTHILFILSLVLLWFNTTTATSFGHQQQLVAAAAHTCIDKERQALLDFKATLQDPNNMLSTWRPEEEDDCCQWSGVRCNNQTGHVTVLDLFNYGLGGEISLSLLNLTYLNHLDLFYNSFHGTIPNDKLWQLPNLQSLYLSSSSLSNDDVSNLSQSIQVIDFSSNKLGPRFPKWIQTLKNLIYLDLSYNSISDTVSAEYWNRWKSSQLSYLDLSFNNISGKLPKSLSNHDLEFIDLVSTCAFRSIPAFPARISFLDLSRNKFDGGLSFLCQLYGYLESLDISHNTLTGQLPDCFQNLTYLEVLNLGHNILSGRIPPSIGYLGQLETLCLYNNSFSGELPLNLKNCTELSLLDLGANILYGNIPVWIGKNMSRLYALSLKSNNLTGTIPSQICQLESLQILDLSFNNLHGTIPPCVNNLTSMVQKGFFLEQNKHHYSMFINHSVIDNSYIDHLLIEWQGKINEFSSILGLLKAIDLSSNNLTGQIPNEVTNFITIFYSPLFNQHPTSSRFPRTHLSNDSSYINFAYISMKH